MAIEIAIYIGPALESEYDMSTNHSLVSGAVDAFGVWIDKRIDPSYPNVAERVDALKADVEKMLKTSRVKFDANKGLTLAVAAQYTSVMDTLRNGTRWFDGDADVDLIFISGIIKN